LPLYSTFRGEAAFRSRAIRIALNIGFSCKSSRRPIESWNEEALSSLGAASREAIALSQLRLMEALHSLPPHRRAALQAARRVDPGATEAQITPPTQPGLLVQMMTSGPEGRMPMMTLHAGGGGVNVGANRVRLRLEDGGVPPPP